jgi:stearoyl-CoA desaturase (delta-9 desaturase)
MKFQITSDTKVKLLQLCVYIILLYTLAFHWDTSLFLVGLVAGWLMFLTGIYGSLHKYSSHRNFEPKNNIIKIFILIMGTLTSLGSNIAWSATHRKHHKYSDLEGDPHSIHTDGGGFWRGLKIYFYYFPTYLINPRTIKDLTVDPMHKWFHKQYYYVIAIYVAVLYIIDPLYVGYFYALPVFYCYTGISYITVIAHSDWAGKLVGYRNFNIPDHTFNWKLGNLVFPGEGNHHNHHAYAGAVDTRFAKGEIDTGLWYIKLIGNINTQEDYQAYPG